MNLRSDFKVIKFIVHSLKCRPKTDCPYFLRKRKKKKILGPEEKKYVEANCNVSSMSN